MDNQLKIINMDCLEWLKSQEDNSIDLIITSPPYNLKNKGGDVRINTYLDKMENNDYNTWQLAIFRESKRVLKNKGAMFYNHKNRFENGLCVSPWELILKCGLKLNQEIIWNRKTSVDNNRARFSTKCEKIFWLFKNETFKLNQNFVSMGEVWDINRPAPKDNFGHKATFPINLIDRIIRSLDISKNAIIVDIFAGTGTVGQAAHKNGFKNIILVENNEIWNSTILNKVYQDYEQEVEPIIKKTYKTKKGRWKE